MDSKDINVKNVYPKSIETVINIKLKINQTTLLYKPNSPF